MKRFLTIGAILLVVGLVVAKNTRMSSYVCTLAKKVQNNMQATVSPEFEIERLDLEIERLKGDVNDLVNQEAVLSVDLAELKQSLTTKQAALEKSRETLLAFANKVKEHSNGNFQFVSHTYTPVAAKKKLADDYELFQSQQASVKSMQNLVTAREQQLNTLRNQRQKIVTQQATYKAKLDQLAADWTLLKNEASSSPASVDNNRFKTIEEGLKQLNRQVEIEKKRAEIHGENHSISGGSPVEAGPQIDPDFVLNAIREPNDANTTVGSTATPK